ncbi:mitochondrial ribosomal protein L27 [Dermatophagoides farinae]|uniref:Ribosomal l27-like protein n=1 Tax=Dermatophagoides farinae TaxID=6954 RepID=A0A9D4P2I9_DERFA|nr:ribosomal l27-like protein [Dermatophagoides farinae]
MASFLKIKNDLFSKCLRDINYFQSRSAKSPAMTQRGYKKKQRIFSLNKIPGDRVDERMMIGTQKHLKYFPGYNCGINPRDKSLYAITAGTVYYSIERVQLNSNNPLVQQYFVNTIQPYYNKYIHVIPDKLENEFRLVDIVYIIMDKRKYTIMAAVTAAVFGAIGYYYYQKRDSIDEAIKKTADTIKQQADVVKQQTDNAQKNIQEAMKELEKNIPDKSQKATKLSSKK